MIVGYCGSSSLTQSTGSKNFTAAGFLENSIRIFQHQFNKLPPSFGTVSFPCVAADCLKQPSIRLSVDEYRVSLEALISFLPWDNAEDSFSITPDILRLESLLVSKLVSVNLHSNPYDKIEYIAQFKKYHSQQKYF